MDLVAARACADWPCLLELVERKQLVRVTWRRYFRSAVIWIDGVFRTVFGRAKSLCLSQVAWHCIGAYLLALRTDGFARSGACGSDGGPSLETMSPGATKPRGRAKPRGIVAHQLRNADVVQHVWMDLPPKCLDLLQVLRTTITCASPKQAVAGKTAKASAEL